MSMIRSSGSTIWSSGRGHGDTMELWISRSPSFPATKRRKSEPRILPKPDPTKAASHSAGSHRPPQPGNGPPPKQLERGYRTVKLPRSRIRGPGRICAGFPRPSTVHGRPRHSCSQLAGERGAGPCCRPGIRVRDDRPFPRGLHQQRPDHSTSRPPVRIDILTKASGVEFDEVWRTRVQGDMDGAAVCFISRECLIKNKKATDRPQDRADLDAIGC